MVRPQHVHSWTEFYSTLVARLGGPRRAQMIFVEQTNRSPSVLQNWRRRGSVPQEAMDDIETLDTSSADFTGCHGPHQPRMYRRVTELEDNGVSNAETARILSREFNRKITINAVKGVRLRAKREKQKRALKQA